MGIQKDKLTQEQKQELERLRNFVSRNGLSTQMNGTKWRAAIDAILAVPGYQASFRVKIITEAAEPPENQWNPSFPAQIPLYNAIEWLELNPRMGPPPAGPGKDRRPDFTEALRNALAESRIPLADSRTGVRIIGYSRAPKR